MKTGKMPLGRRVTLPFKLIAPREKRQNAAVEVRDAIVENPHPMMALLALNLGPVFVQR